MLKDFRTVWAGCLRTIAAEIGEQSFKTWFRPIIPVELKGNVLTIQVPSAYFYDWLEEHYVDELRRALYQELGREGRLEYSVVVDQGNEQARPRTLHLPTTRKAAAPDPHDTPAVAHPTPPSAPMGNPLAGSGRAAAARYVSSADTRRAAPGAQTTFAVPRNPFESVKPMDGNLVPSQLNGSYTFDNYIEGDCNRLARSAGLAVANKPGTTSFNPLMVYGGVGLGKTHLVQAIGNHIKATAPERFVLYVSAEKFTNQFIDSVQRTAVQEFANFYLQVDALILDDVQFLANKGKTQEMFFHIFNHLHQSGKQIVMTSDRPPKDLQGLEDRLLNRFKWGLTADVQSPDFETRVAIIRNKMDQDGIDIPPPHVVDYLANSVHTNVRELEGVIASLVAQSSLSRRDIDLEMVKQALRHIIEEVEAEVNLDFIQKTVAAYFGISVDLLKDKTRKKEVVTARQVAMYFAKHHTSHTLKTIGFHFGGRDHTTVMHSVQTVSDLVDSDKKFREQVDELRKKFAK
ncbi:chromosomal replication initiator protein DnaA [Hymenobacter sp. ASUV-10]|uniref:Chromosomal replication initiator protein DnaA n=1 Tax=Hymenobacter aranciens TaxID=3063996 RepID=A0ABT9BEC0_9BACT|nr:chromosomal replication initiator protein DnaA [Hymenobacter sp. ASUV-10]MDO7876621.1 chromosomal replication initiator protein DnaA [Hymenobacter sp. ASUV-10]